MAFEYGFFWDSSNGDRKYNAASFEHWLRKFFTNGVFSGDLQVTVGNNMTVNVSTGYVNINGKVRFFESETELSISTAHASLGRVDAIVIERNDTDRSIELKVKTGTPSASPVAPSPTRGTGIYQLVLAQIRVPAGAVSINQNNIRDVREDTHLCGLVTGTVKEMDASHLRMQFDALCDECTAMFKTWFENIKNQLSADAAGNLQNQIDGIKSHFVKEGIADGLRLISTDAVTVININAKTKPGTNRIVEIERPILKDLQTEGSPYFDFPADCEGKSCLVRIGSSFNGVLAMNCEEGKAVSATITIPTSMINDQLLQRKRES